MFKKVSEYISKCTSCLCIGEGSHGIWGRFFLFFCIYTLLTLFKKRMFTYFLLKNKKKILSCCKAQERNSHDVDNYLLFTLKCSHLEGPSPDYGGNALFLVCLYFPYQLFSKQSFSLETINPPQDIDFPLDLGKEEAWTTSSHPQYSNVISIHYVEVPSCFLKQTVYSTGPNMQILPKNKSFPTKITLQNKVSSRNPRLIF